MRKLLGFALAALVWVGASAPAYSQNTVLPCTQGTATASRNCIPVSANAPLPTTAGASSAEGVAIEPTAVASATSGLVLKTAAGNLYSLQVANAATGGYVLLMDQTTVPSAGAVTPSKCFFMPSAAGNLSLSFNPPLRFSSGIIMLYSSAGCFTFTASNPTFMSGEVK